MHFSLLQWLLGRCLCYFIFCLNQEQITIACCFNFKLYELFIIIETDHVLFVVDANDSPEIGHFEQSIRQEVGDKDIKYSLLLMHNEPYFLECLINGHIKP